MHLRLLAPLAAASALLCAPVHAQFFSPPPDWARVKTPESRVHDPSVSPVPHWFEVRRGSWQVPLETVQHMVSLIEARVGSNTFFDKSRSAAYAIQFRGETRGDRQIVRIAGACSLGGFPAEELSAGFVRVFDGGKCNFDAEYDPLEKRLSAFQYHGYG